MEGHITRLKLLKPRCLAVRISICSSERFVLAPGRVQGRVQRPQALSEEQAQPAAALAMERRDSRGGVPRLASPRCHAGLGAVWQNLTARDGWMLVHAAGGCVPCSYLTSPKVAKSRIWAHWQRMWVRGLPYLHGLRAQNRSCLRPRVILFAGRNA